MVSEKIVLPWLNCTSLYIPIFKQKANQLINCLLNYLMLLWYAEQHTSPAKQDPMISCRVLESRILKNWMTLCIESIKR